MSDLVNERFERFRDRFLAEGAANPREYLEGLEGDERAELELLIEVFLIEAPPRPWNEEEFKRTGAAAFAERMAAEIVADMATGEKRLIDLRTSAEIARESLVDRLARELDLPDETESVSYYYHHLERGNLPVEGVSESVFEALSRILKVSAKRIRDAAEASRRDMGPGEPVFARTVTGTRPILEAAEAEIISFESPDSSGEVDRLFTKG